MKNQDIITENNFNKLNSFDDNYNIKNISSNYKIETTNLIKTSKINKYIKTETLNENENCEIKENNKLHKNSFLITGGNKISGEIEIETAKNAILPILAGCILINGVVTIHKPTYFEDVLNMLEILKSLGVKVETYEHTLILNCRYINNYIITDDKTSKLRASIVCLGPLLARLKKARMAYPGGCAIGSRPIDIHLQSLEKFGVKIIDKHGYITAYGDKLKAEKIVLPFPSVGATENLIMANVLTKGITEIVGCAKEPEIVDLCNFLNKMGAKIYGAGTDTVVIDGVCELHGGEYTPISDRIIAGTYLMLPLICGGDIQINNVELKHISPLIDLLKNNSCNIKQKGGIIRVTSKSKLKNFGKVECLPYPHFPTDLQQQLTTLACFAKGTTIIVENIFENRFKHVPELVKMGAKIVVKDKTMVVTGVKEMFGAEVYAHDLRGGACLILAGLGANGYTTIKNASMVDRGYYKIEQKLTNLGANIIRI